MADWKGKVRLVKGQNTVEVRITASNELAARQQLEALYGKNNVIRVTPIP